MTADRYRFEDFIRDTSRLTTSAALFDRFAEVMGSFGYGRVIFTAPIDPEMPDHLQKMGLFNSYPEDWQKYYVEKGFARIDPVLKCASTLDWAFRWSDMERALTLSDQQTRFMRMAEDAGLNNGVGIPLTDGFAQVAGVALATADRQDECLKDLDLINAYCTQFYMSYKRLQEKAKPLLPVTLTPRETEILTHVAAGRTDDDIATLMTISRNTVDTHMRHIFHKLDVNSRVAAAVRGIMTGLIRP